MSAVSSESNTQGANESPDMTTTMNGSQSSSTNSQQGIDIHKALSILSDRTPHSHSHDHDHDSMEENGGGGCCHGAEASEQLKQMGQTIDLLAETDKKNEESPEGKMSPEERKIAEEKINKERAERREKIRKELDSMTTTQLLKAVLTAQEDRVKTYKEYESGLLTVLQTGNMTNYPDTCSKATASFSVLSETIKTIQEIFESRKRTDLHKAIKQLQSYEKEKLQLTAAYHLERIRQNSHEQQLLSQGGTNIDPSSGDARIAKLLNQGVSTLQSKITACIENINEVLDDIRCALLEEDDE